MEFGKSRRGVKPFKGTVWGGMPQSVFVSAGIDSLESDTPAFIRNRDHGTAGIELWNQKEDNI